MTTMQTKLMYQVKQAVKRFLKREPAQAESDHPTRFSIVTQIHWRLRYDLPLTHEEISFLAQAAHQVYIRPTYPDIEISESRPHAVDVALAALKVYVLVKPDEQLDRKIKHMTGKAKVKNYLTYAVVSRLRHLEELNFQNYAFILMMLTWGNISKFKEVDIQEVNKRLRPHLYNLYLLAKAAERVNGPCYTYTSAEDYEEFLEAVRVAQGGKLSTTGEDQNAA